MTTPSQCRTGQRFGFGRPEPRNSTPCRVLPKIIACKTSLCLAAVVGFTSVGFAQQRKDGAAEAKWDVLEGCRLLTNSVTDGDSFHALYNSREYIFRLYFVDAPETDASLRDRVADQAAYFGISPNDIPKAATLAAQFTRGTLAGAKFTVVTRWQNAQGRSSLARFYAVVLVSGRNLAEELVERGLARIYGPRANWPDGPRSAAFINKLKDLELRAQEQKLGIWDSARFPRLPSAATGGRTSTTAVAGRVEINSASFEELQALPGIGPVLAERIIAHRPYKNPEDLDRVPGIGAKMLERLRPLIEVEAGPPK
jgi:competence ComEA-like helix-hairpin-helix protein